MADEASLQQEEARREQQLRQQRQAAKRAAPAKAAKGAAEKMVLDAGKKYLLRVISGVCGITVAGLIVTALIMNFQLFYGNILKGGESAIALSIFEIIFIIALDLLIAVIIALAFVLLLLGMCIITHPIKATWDVIWGDFPNRCLQ